MSGMAQVARGAMGSMTRVGRGLVAAARPGLRGLGRRLADLWRSLPKLGRRLLELIGLGLLWVVTQALTALGNWAWNRYLNWNWLNIALAIGAALWLLGLFIGFCIEAAGEAVDSYRYWRKKRAVRAAWKELPGDERSPVKRIARQFGMEPAAVAVIVKPETAWRWYQGEDLESDLPARPGDGPAPA